MRGRVNLVDNERKKLMSSKCAEFSYTVGSPGKEGQQRMMVKESKFSIKWGNYNSACPVG